MTNKAIENAKAKVERLEALETDFVRDCDKVLVFINTLVIEKQAAIETAPKSDKAVLKAHLKKLQRAIKLLDGGNM